MATASQGQYTLLVANFSRPTPSSIQGSDTIHHGPTKVRSGFVFGHLEELGFSSDLVGSGSSRSVVNETINVAIDPFENTPPTAPTADVTVASNTFSAGSATLVIGPYQLVAFRDWIPGGGVVATATAIAAAINNLGGGYVAVPVGATVTVSGPLGSGPRSVAFTAAYMTATANFTFVYPASQGFLGYTDSPLFVGILPPPPVLYSAP